MLIILHVYLYENIDQNYVNENGMHIPENILQLDDKLMSKRRELVNE